MDILPIQATAVPCERVFSSGKETMTPRRNRITPDLMEQLQMLKFSIKRGGTLNFTHGLSMSDEIAALEKRFEDLDDVPNDLKSYVLRLKEL